MLLVTTSAQHRDDMVIEARANLSMSLDGLSAVFAALCVVSLLVVAWPVFLGLWPVLLATLIHLAVVGWCFRAAWRGNWARERLAVEGDQLVVEQFRLGQLSRSEWPAAWTRVELSAGRCRELRAFVSSQGKRQEIGSFLPQTEREELVRMVRTMLQQQPPWHESHKTIRIS